MSDLAKPFHPDTIPVETMTNEHLAYELRRVRGKRQTHFYRQRQAAVAAEILRRSKPVEAQS
jgi:hypothetical protein